jgi:cytidylate kinase
VTWAAQRRGIDLRDEEALAALAGGLIMDLNHEYDGDRLLVDGADVTDHLRDPEVERGVSQVASVSGVRAALVEQQRSIARESPIVMVGRDIGTVVLPEAAVKVYLTAPVAVRAGRRALEIESRGGVQDRETVMSDLIRRDKIDSERSDSPLRPARDAALIDTDGLAVEELADRILLLVRRR